MVRRQKAPSKSNSSSSKRLNSPPPSFKPNPSQNIKTVHPHLQQFSKARPEESQLKKRPVGENEQQISRYSFVPTQAAIPQQPLQQEHSVIYGYRPVSNHETVNSPIKTASVNRPFTPQQPFQRQLSAPQFLTVQPQLSFVQTPARNMVYPAPNIIVQPVQPVYHRPVEQQSASNYRYAIHNNCSTQNSPQQLRQVPIQQPVMHFNQSPLYVSKNIPHQNHHTYQVD